jgi:hypothetical protein
MSWAYLGFSFLEAPATSSVEEYNVAVALNFFAAITLLLHSATSLYWRYRLDGRLIRRYLLQVRARTLARRPCTPRTCDGFVVKTRLSHCGSERGGGGSVRFEK